MKERLQAIKDETITKIENAGDMNVLNEIQEAFINKKKSIDNLYQEIKDIKKLRKTL